MDFDLFDHRSTQRHLDLVGEWQRSSPVRTVMDGYHFVARYDDVKAVLRDPRRFPNGNGFKRPGVVVPDDERNLGEMDPPLHPFVRRLLRPAFTPAHTEAERRHAASTAADLFAALPDECDLVPVVAQRYPARVAFHYLGFPPDDTEQILAWVNELMRSTYPSEGRTERGEGLAGAFPEFSAYVDALVDDRRSGRNPADDLIARMTLAEYEGERLNQRMLRRLVINMMTGSLSTTSNLIGNLLHQVLTDPELHAALRERPDLVPAAVEESLRLHPPVMFVVRQIAVDTEVAGMPVPGGERLIVGTGAANRDESVFPEPSRFRLDRPDEPGHLTFSAGPHVCIGAGLARMSGAELLGAFVSRFEPGEWALPAAFEWEGTPVFLEYGPASLPVHRATSTATG